MLPNAAVAALVVESVPLAQTAVSAGINTVMRTIGGTLGASVGGSLLTSSITASGYPSPAAYTTAVLVYATALIGAALLASRVPRPDGSRTAGDATPRHFDNAAGQARARVEIVLPSLRP
jgi:predicted MFS family arabinose efflux permease